MFNVMANRVEEVAVKYSVSGNDFTTLKIASEGVSPDLFFDILDFSNFTKDELAELMDLSFKTVQRYHKQHKKFNALNSEQLLKIVSLFQKGIQVFGSTESFNSWLRKPAYGLGNEQPFQLLHTSGGIDLIIEEIHRIEHGALA